jgi:hypothetical protein
MRFTRPLPPLALVCLLVAGTRAQQQLSVVATILDPATNAAPQSLTPEEVRVTEDGSELKVLNVEAVDLTVKAQLLIDNGIGMGANLSQLRSALRGLVELLPAGIETSIYTTAPQSRMLQRPTKNRTELLKAVDRLAPDSTPGRFTESLTEAAERANKDKDTFSFIISAGTTSGDGNLPQGETRRLQQIIAGRPLVVHVLLYGGERSAFGGQQIAIGERVTKMTDGRYEYINSMNRYVTLLPEFGAEVAKQMAASTRQFRITAQRADGKTGPVGTLTITAGDRILSHGRIE